MSNQKQQTLKNKTQETKYNFETLYSFAKEFVSKQMIPFTIDDLREEFLKSNPVPEKRSIFGSVLSELSRNNLIKFNERHVKSKAKGNRGRIIKQWISIEYSEKQSAKRISDETKKSRELAKQQTNLNL